MTTEKFPHLRELMSKVSKDPKGINFKLEEVHIYWNTISVEMANLEDEIFELHKKKDAPPAPKTDEEPGSGNEVLEMDIEEEDRKSTTRQSRRRVRSPPRKTKTFY